MLKFFYRSEFYTHEHKIQQSEPENYLLTICIHTKLIYGTVLRYDQSCVEKLPPPPPPPPPRENPEKQAKTWNFLISASKYQKYTKFTSRYMFLWMTNAMQLVKMSLRITKDVKIQDGQLWLKNRFRYQASSKIHKLWNLTHTPTHLVCNIHLIANFLSFHMSLVVVMHFGAGNALHGIEKVCFGFIKLYFIHISKDILLLQAQRAVKQCKRYLFRLKICKIGKSAIMLSCTATSSIAHDFWK